MSEHEDSYHDILYRNIGRLLGEADWTRQRAAAEIGMKRGTFSAKLHATSDFRLGELIKLAAALDTPFSELVRGFDQASELHAGISDEAVPA